MYKSELSNYFPFTTGLVQGEAFFNDFEIDFKRCCYESVEFKDLSVFLLMYIYAKDTVNS